MKSSLGLGTQLSGLPEKVGAGQRRVAAQIDLHRGGKPAQLEAFCSSLEKGGLGEIHLAGQELHLESLGESVQQTHGRRVAAKGSIGKGIDLGDLHGLSHSQSVNKFTAALLRPDSECLCC